MAATEGRWGEHEARKKVVLLMQQQIDHANEPGRHDATRCGAARCNKMRLKKILLLPIQLGACSTLSRRQAKTRRRKNNALLSVTNIITIVVIFMLHVQSQIASMPVI